MRNVKIAMVQFNSKLGDVEGNITRGIEFVRQASEQGADIIAFPELYACGYDIPYLSEHKEEVSLEEGDELVNRMAEAAAKYNISVIMPCSLKENGEYYNGEFLFGRKGEILGTYKKVHLWDEEAKVFTKGSEYHVFDMDFGKLGLLICYDAGFPEASRMLALSGAEVTLVSGAFCGLHWDRYKTYYKPRALENTMYVGAINATGGFGIEVWFGNNRFYDMNGEKMMEGRINIEEMQIVTADLDLVQKARAEGCYLTDLRPSTYKY